ncbi:MAG TPA: zinc ABC transporter substrate-binding protein [Synechococcales cyanobacterium M55_K2018_004]|nr:zinc ABC transporter substrate-binding protein [Synechococcales cyanobacterium M55_K2018_004]
MNKRFWGLALVTLVGAIAFSCMAPPSPSPAEKVQVMVSIAPQKYFVERIGDGYVNVDVMVPPGAEPHTFEPRPEQLKALSRSDLYLRIRIEFEDAWMDKLRAANPRMLVVDTTEGIQRLPLPDEFRQAGHAGEAENLDPHIWLSPRLVKTQAQTIYRALVQVDAEHQAAYQANLSRFLADLDALDAEIRQKLQGVQSRQFIVFHPGWGYFARDYGLTMVPIEVGGQEPSAAELARLVTRAKQDQIKVIFAEPQFSQQTATTLSREIGGKVLLIDPLSPDWMNNLRQVADTFAAVLGQKPEVPTRFQPPPAFIAEFLYAPLSWL